MNWMVLLISFVVGVVVGVSVLSYQISRLKTAKEKRSAADYVRPGSLHIDQRQDIYLYRSTQKVPINRDDNH